MVTSNAMTRPSTAEPARPDLTLAARVLPHFDFRVASASRTVRGHDRSANEDAVLCRPDLALFGLADGMGGHGSGEVASGLALRAAAESLATEAARSVVARYARSPSLDRRREVFGLLHTAMHEAHEVVRGAGAGDRQGMGTTLDLLLLARDRAFLAHVGDARAYLVRPLATVQLTHDHTLFDTLRTTGKRSRPEARSPTPLSNSLGNRDEVVVDTLSVDVSAADRVVLCTDGVFEALDAEAALAAVGAGGAPGAMLDRLLGLADRSAGRDDMSAIVISIEDRFVRRATDAGPRALDLATVSASPLLSDLPPAAVLSALAAAVEIELQAGDEVPCTLAGDRVAYLVLGGSVALPDGRVLGASALLLAESLLDVAMHGRMPAVVEQARLLRIRYDDFREVCSHDAGLAAQLYRRIAKHLATAGPTPR